MALTLEVRPTWPGAKQLAKLGTHRADLTGPEVDPIFENVADVLSDIAPELRARFNNGAHPQDRRSHAQSLARRRIPITGIDSKFGNWTRERMPLVKSRAFWEKQDEEFDPTPSGSGVWRLGRLRGYPGADPLPRIFQPMGLTMMSGSILDLPMRGQGTTGRFAVS